MSDSPAPPPVQGLHPAVLIGGYLAIALAPIALAAAQQRPSHGWAADFSSGVALAGLAMILLQFLTSGRFERTTGRVGIDMTMHAHQIAARFVLALLVLHPFAYALPGAPSFSAAASSVVTLYARPALLSGVAAWLLLIALIVSAIWRDRLPVRYEVWRASHGAGAALVGALGVHHALTAGRFSADVPMTTLWFVLLAVAVGSLLRVYVFTPALQLRRPWRIASVRQVGDRLWELALEPAADFTPRLTAGQFYWLTLGRSPFSITEHPFSAASSAAQLPRLEFLVKENGDFTRSLGALPVGGPAYVDGPRGVFTLAGRRASGIGLVAGGVGIAPILGILRQLRADRDPRPVRLLWGNRQAGQIVYRDEIDHVGDVLDFRARYVLSEPPPAWPDGAGVLDRHEVQSFFNARDRDQWIYFACGPEPMMDTVEQSLVRIGVPARQIVSERFHYR